jgi:hypothetical protein
MPMNFALVDNGQSRRKRLILLGRVQDAEAEHDRARRAHFAGVTTASLDAEKTLWTEVGVAIAELAGRFRDGCAASLFTEGNPRIEDVAARLSEAIDDQFDAYAWRVMDAAARLAAHDR